MTRVAGVDGGATRSRAVLLDEEREVAAAAGPAAAVEPGRVEEAAEVVEALVRELAAAAGASLPLEGLSCGLAGAGRSETRRAACRALERRGLARRVTVVTDADAAFRDAFEPGRSGLLLVAGTGSIARARGPEGRDARAGGWGVLLGDEGSAYRIGLEGLRAVLRAHDGRIPPTSLAPRLLSALDVEEPPDLVSRVEGEPKAGIAALAPTVVGAADGGDVAARRIVGEAVRALVDQIRAAATGAGLDDRTAPVALTGGLLAPGRPLRDRVAEALRDEGFEVSEREVRPERGAALLGR